MTWGPALACIVATALMLNAERADDTTQRMIFKPLAALAFIVSAVTLGALSKGAPGYALLVGLVLGAAGDVLLIPEDNKKAFLAGIGSFGASHLAYVVMFLLLGVSVKGLAILVVLGPLAWFIWTWLREHTGKLRNAVIGYIGVITAMVTAAAGALIAAPDPARQVLMAAAVIFFVSDLCVARHRFVQPAVINRYIGLPLYFGAQLLYGYGISLL